MTKNIVLLHDRVKFWLDVSRSPRFLPKQIDSAINIAIDDIIKDRFIPNTPANKNGIMDIKGLERTRLIKNELAPIVKVKSDISINGNRLLFNDQNFPTDYYVYTSMEIVINSNIYNPIEVSQEFLRGLREDPFSRPSISPEDKTYFKVTNEGFTFYVGQNTITKVNLSYLAKQATVFYGFEKRVVNVTNGAAIIIAQDACTFGSTNYKLGDQLVKPGALSTAEENVLVVTDWVNSEMPDILFEEIAKRAAESLLLTVAKSMANQSGGQ